MSPVGKDSHMSDTHEVEATFAGAAPRHFPGLGLTVEPGGTYLIPAGVAHELADVFHPVPAKKAAAKTTTTEGEE